MIAIERNTALEVIKRGNRPARIDFVLCDPTRNRFRDRALFHALEVLQNVIRTA